jgi:hypothetical protein
MSYSLNFHSELCQSLQSLNSSWKEEQPPPQGMQAMQAMQAMQNIELVSFS